MSSIVPREERRHLSLVVVARYVRNVSKRVPPVDTKRRYQRRALRQSRIADRCRRYRIRCETRFAIVDSKHRETTKIDEQGRVLLRNQLE